MYSWPLNDSQFTWLDRAKLAAFFLNPKNRWTMGEQVRLFEREMAEFVGAKHAVFVSSGSTANTLLAMYLKDMCPERSIIFPSTTWTTSVAPFIREGFKPIFVDVNMADLSMDLNQVEKILKTNRDISCMFPTSLLGFVPDMDRLAALEYNYGVRVFMDNCENTLGTWRHNNISRFFTSTTSTYFGHQLQSVEGGFIFTNWDNQYEYFLMARSHGMTRNISPDNAERYRNKDVNERFDFYMLGNNFRNSDVHALIGRLDLKRAPKYAHVRRELYREFKNHLDPEKFILPKDEYDRQHVAFALPVIYRNPAPEIKGMIKICEQLGIETRPIISGNLLRQTCYKKYDIHTAFPNSEHLHQNGFYVGLHPKVTKEQVRKLAKTLNIINPC